MKEDLLQRLAEESQSYSKRQKAIARYICENSETVSFMTSRMLSQAAQVSESSVVRFARQLGYGGYSELRRDLQQLIRDRLSTHKKEETLLEAEELKQTVDTGSLSLRSIMTGRNQRALEEAVELLDKADRIVVQSGLGMDGINIYFANSLRALGFDACSAPGGLSREIFELDDKSALLIISGSYFSQLFGSARYAREKGAAVLVVADDEAAPMGNYANVMLPGKGIIAVAALIEALLCALENSCGRSLDMNLAELDALHREYDTYESGEN